MKTPRHVLIRYINTYVDGSMGCYRKTLRECNARVKDDTDRDGIATVWISYESPVVIIDWKPV